MRRLLSGAALLAACSVPEADAPPAPRAAETAHIAASTLHPGWGELVRLWLSRSDNDAPRWHGVDEFDGLSARVVALPPWPLQGEADGVQLTLQLEPAFNDDRLQLGTPSLRQPLPQLKRRCRDRRYPRLAGAWAVGCGSEGLISLALDLRDGGLLQLEQAAETPATGDGVLFAPGRHQGLWRLPSTQPSGGRSTATRQPIAPAAVDGEHAALLLEGRVTAFKVGDKGIKLLQAQPLPWQTPALSWPVMAWVDGSQRERTGSDIRTWNLERDTRSRPLTQAPGHQRHVAASGHWVGWQDDEGVWVEDLRDGRRSFTKADTGFRAGLSLWGPVACWEERADGDIDIACSDGLRVDGPGDQGWPSRWGPWLLYRQDDIPHLATAQWILLDDDDPRATWEGRRERGGFRGAHIEGELSYQLAWPAEGWCVEVWQDGSWQLQGPMSAGPAVRLSAPGDALRLRPASPPDGGCARVEP